MKSFDRNHYLSWYIPRIRSDAPAINLHSSGVPALDPNDFDIRYDDPWTAVSRFETALCDWLGIDSPDQLIFTPGATGGTLLALLSLARKDSNIMVETPIYEPMIRQSERLCQVERIVRSPQNNWRLPLDDIQKLITHETSLIMITEPHNPSGCFAPSQQILELSELARTHGAMLLINEVYREYSDRPSYHLMGDNILIVSSLSKLLGAYWARLGWISGHESLISRFRQGHLNMSMASSPSAEAGVAILNKAREIRNQSALIAEKGAEIVDQWVQSFPAISWTKPQGPGFGCISLPDGMDDITIAETLHREHDLLLIPGAFFEIPGTLRLCWLQTGEDLEKGLEIIESTIRKEL